MVAGLQQVPEGVKLPLQGLLGPLALGNVADHRHHRPRLAAGIADDGGRNLGGRPVPSRPTAVYSVFLRTPVLIRSTMFSAIAAWSLSIRKVVGAAADECFRLRQADQAPYCREAKRYASLGNRS